MAAYRIGLVGIGTIAKVQHVPSIRANADFELVAIASTSGARVEGVPHSFRTHGEMLAGVKELDAVAICTPPSTRHAIARDVMLAGRHALLEKPPAASVGALTDLARIAGETGRVLFTTWHSQYNAAVGAAADALRGEAIRRLRIEWKEDVRVWHPGATWMWDAAGFGVFDPGINALSILTRIAPHPVFVTAAEMAVPANKQTPIRAELTLSTGRDAPEDLTAFFDWGHTGDESWTMDIETQAGRRLRLEAGGNRLVADGAVIAEGPSEEYPAIYRHFAQLLRQGRSHVDDAPFRLVSDAFLLGRRTSAPEFTD
ncbi:MAG: Gfo/Idh/MocA family oxidoreductase [Acetobacteraceae bacterium]|nr:Gfo/Idh/MocA family oxidoreductase [Acetobacteraceae bacterium]